MDQDFSGRVAIVTGGGSGIGEAVATGLAGRGATVVVSDISEEAADRVVGGIRSAGGAATAFVADTSDPEASEATVAHAVAEHGGLHLAVDNAGIGGEPGLVGDLSVEGWRKVIDVNLSGVFYGLRYQIPAMLESGGGSIVTMSSILGLVAEPTAPAYTAAKHAVAGLTKAAAVGYAAQGIRINSVHPGYIETPLLSRMPADQKDALVGLHPMGRLGTAEEVAALVLWLLSDAASFSTGGQYTTDGGYTSR